MSDENPYAPPAVEMSAPGVDWMKADPRGLSRTARGLSLVYFGIVVVLLSVVLSLAVVLPLQRPFEVGGASAFPPLLLVAMAGLFVGSIMMLVGPLMCLSVPAEIGAKGLIVASVALQLVNLVLPAIFQLLSIVSAALFVLFMRKLALYIGQTKLADQARNVLVTAGATLVLAMIECSMFVLGAAAKFLTLLVGVMMLIAFVMYANLVNALRKALVSSDIAD